ncbi:MAG TPA: UbiX family flavin prenyltransferase [Candidatus Angelobacter sp.]|nr:UbiX family flavin prenyltransferase [Candidatus Angelobacter sp.]
MPNLLHPSAHVLTVAATGASGALFTRALLLALEHDDRVKTVNFIASSNALRVFAEELAIKGRNDLVRQLIGKPSKKIQQQNNDDIGGNVASGSYPTHAMIVIPCSMGTLARIAHGLAGNLIDRAADVCLKEKRPLVLCTRETPLNRVHIRNMEWAADAGATIYPLIPTFYNHPKNFDEMAHQFACRVLQFVGLPQNDAYQWGGGNPPPRYGDTEKNK